MFVMEGYTAEMDQMSGNTCVHGSNVLRINGNAQLMSLLVQKMCVMIGGTAKMDQMRILRCVLNGTVQLGTGNATTGSSVYRRDWFVEVELHVVMDQVMTLQCVPSGIVLTGIGNVLMA